MGWRIQAIFAMCDPNTFKLSGINCKLNVKMSHIEISWHRKNVEKTFNKNKHLWKLLQFSSSVLHFTTINLQSAINKKKTVRLNGFEKCPYQKSLLKRQAEKKKNVKRTKKKSELKLNRFDCGSVMLLHYFSITYQIKPILHKILKFNVMQIKW